MRTILLSFLFTLTVVAAEVATAEVATAEVATATTGYVGYGNIILEKDTVEVATTKLIKLGFEKPQKSDFDGVDEVLAFVDGKFLNHEAIVVLGPKDGIIMKVVLIVMLDEAEQALYLKAKKPYNTIVEALTKKYKKPDQAIEHFMTPYERGDGYEMQALRVNKAMVQTGWDKQKIFVTLKDKFVSVHYESPTFQEVAEEQEKTDTGEL